MEVTLNTTQSLFVIKTGASVSCLGFDVVYSRSMEMCRRLEKAGQSCVHPTPEQKGTMAQYEQYARLLTQYARIGDTETWFTPGTPEVLKLVLEHCRTNSRMVRLFFGNYLTGEDQLEEYDTVGRVSRTTGYMKSLILVPRRQSGGSIINSQAIVKIVDVETDEVLFKNSNYHLPAMKIGESGCLDDDSYTHGLWVTRDGEVVNTANFRSQAEADAYLEFISGKCHRLRRVKQAVELA